MSTGQPAVHAVAKALGVLDELAEGGTLQSLWPVQTTRNGWSLYGVLVGSLLLAVGARQQHWVVVDWSPAQTVQYPVVQIRAFARLRRTR